MVFGMIFTTNAFAAKKKKDDDGSMAVFDAENGVTYVNGLVASTKVRNTGRKMSGEWTFGVRNQLNFDTPNGIEGYKAMSFTIYGNEKLPGIFCVRLLGGDNPKAYYMVKNVSAQPGWNKVVIPLSTFGANGGADFGLGDVKCIQFLCEGWGMEKLYETNYGVYDDIKDNIKVYFDEVTLYKEDISQAQGSVVATEFEYDKEPLKGFDGMALMLNNSNAYAGGKMKKIDNDNDKVYPEVVNNRTLVPVRFISENFGADVSWNGEKKEVSITLGQKDIRLTIDSDKMLINGTESVIDAAAQVINDRTMVPLRAISEALDKDVFWDARGLIAITGKDKAIDETKDSKTVDSLIGLLKNGEVTYYNSAPKFTQEMIDEACAARTMYFTKGLDTANFGCAGLECKGAKALYYLTYLARSDENAKSSSGVSVKTRAAEQIKSILYNGREPFCSSGPYWAHSVLSSSLLLVKNTPAVYSELTDDEKQRMDYIMRALAITANWGFNDQNNYLTGFDMRGNFSKGWNPNYRAAGLIPVLNAAMYFGADELNNIFTGFNYDEYMKKFEEFGFENIIYSWKIAGKNTMEKGGGVKLTDGTDGGSGKGVKTEFEYNKKPLSDILGISYDLFDYIYSKQVKSEAGVKGTSAWAHIVNNETSPYEGQLGMMGEFDASDANGIRSSAGYCYDSMMCVMPFYTNLKMFGGWNSETDKQKELDKKIYVGTNDLIFKLEQGYQGYQKGKEQLCYEYTETGLGYALDKDLWNKVHLFKAEDTKCNKDPNEIKYEEVDSKDGTTQAPEGALESVSSPGLFSSDIFYPLDQSYSGEFTIDFDLTYSPNVDREFDGVITFHDKSLDGLTYKDLNILIQSLKGSINIMDGASYKQTGFAAAGNYKYHFRVLINTESRKYSVWLTQQYPNAQEEKLVANNYDFRSSGQKITGIGVCGIVTQGADSSMWIENLKVSK